MAFLDFIKPQQKYPDPYAQPIDRKRVILFAAIGGALLLAIILTLVNIFSADPKKDFMIMLSRHQNLVTTINSSKDRIKNSQFAKINSSASLLFTGDTVALQEQLSTKFNVQKIDDNIKSQASDPTIDEDLKEAVLLDKYDVTYRNILRTQLNTLILEALKIKDSTKGQSFTTTMDKYIEDLKAIDSQLDQLEL